MNVDKVTEHVLHLRDTTRQGEISAFYLIDDEELSVIDAGIRGHAADQFLEGAAELRRKPSDLKHIFLTHMHHDSMGGVLELKAIAPDAKVHAPRPAAGAVRDPEAYLKTKCFPRDKSEKVYFAVRNDPFQDLQFVKKPAGVDDGDKFTLGNGTLFAIQLGGHTAGHTMYFLSTERIMFSGDACGIYPGSHSNYVVDGTGSLADFKKTLKFLDGAKIGFLCPGHDSPSWGTSVKESIHGTVSAMEQMDYNIQLILSDIRMARLERLANDVYQLLGVSWDHPWHQLAPKPTMHAHLTSLVKQQKVLATSKDKDSYYKLVDSAFDPY